jgi:hypothetical protein
MKRMLCVALAMMIAVPAMADADCYPPLGLPIGAWYNMCAPAIQQLYQRVGPNMPYEQFTQMLYGQYVNTWSGQQGPVPGPQTCPLGAAQCFNHYLRTCQAVGVGTMWITGAQRC